MWIGHFSKSVRSGAPGFASPIAIPVDYFEVLQSMGDRRTRPPMQKSWAGALVEATLPRLRSVAHLFRVRSGSRACKRSTLRAVRCIIRKDQGASLQGNRLGSKCDIDVAMCRGLHAVRAVVCGDGEIRAD